ncbi:10550_t:CDS:2, partial [Acaulospora colombiana]
METSLPLSTGRRFSPSHGRGRASTLPALSGRSRIPSPFTGVKPLQLAEGDSRNLLIPSIRMKVDLTKYVEQHAFVFDDVFDYEANNEEVYKRTALPLVEYIFRGGLYVLAARDIFNLLQRPEFNHLAAYIGFYEIYQGQLYDLLNERKKLFAREDGKKNVIISGLQEYTIDNVDALMQVFDYGNTVRSTGSTGANEDSSRSHAILQIVLKHRKNRKKFHGKLSFIDLAGSERECYVVIPIYRMEGAEINKSLLALKECIRALDQDKRHTPFRQSKLTQEFPSDEDNDLFGEELPSDGIVDEDFIHDNPGATSSSLENDNDS